MENTMECTYCHGEIPKEAKKCQHCGEWLNGRQTPGQQGVAFTKALIVAIGIIVVLGIYFSIRG